MDTYSEPVVNYTGTLESIASNETMLNTINDPLITHFAVGYNSSDENKTYTVAFFSMSGYYKVKVVSD